MPRMEGSFPTLLGGGAAPFYEGGKDDIGFTERVGRFHVSTDHSIFSRSTTSLSKDLFADAVILL